MKPNCPHCRAREALAAVERELGRGERGWREIALKKSRAHWQREMDRQSCQCEPKGEVA